MTIEQIKDELYRLKSDIRTGYPLRTTQQKENFMNSIDVAIKSLETLEVVSEELEKFNIWYVYKILNEFKKEI